MRTPTGIDLRGLGLRPLPAKPSLEDVEVLNAEWQRVTAGETALEREDAMNIGTDEERLLNALRRLADGDGWVIDKSFPALVAESGCGLRSIPRHIDLLVKAGKIHCVRERGRGRRNSYRIIVS